MNALLSRRVRPLIVAAAVAAALGLATGSGATATHAAPAAGDQTQAVGAVTTASAPNPDHTVTVHGTYADFSFTNATPVMMTLRIGEQAPNPDGTLDNVINTFQSGRRLTHWPVFLNALAPSTGYYWTMTATGAGGQSTTLSSSFMTKDRIVAVSLDSVTVEKDGDLLGSGLIQFTLKAGSLEQQTGPLTVSDGDVVHPGLSLSVRAGTQLRIAVVGTEGGADIFDGDNSVNMSQVVSVNQFGRNEDFRRTLTWTGEDGSLKITAQISYHVRYSDRVVI